MSKSIQISYDANAVPGPLLATISPGGKRDRLAAITAAAVALIPQMNADALTDERRPMSYRQFRALAFLAAEIAADDSCPADHMTTWKQLAAAEDGTEPPAGRCGRFTIEWQGVTIEIRYEPDWSGVAHDHLELEAISPAKARFPITETGYRSHFLDRREIVSAGGVKAFALAMIEGDAASKEWREEDEASRQLALF